MSLLSLMAVAAVLAGLSALLSGIETALFSLQSFQVKRLHERNPALARALEALLENPRRTLSAILLADVGTNVPLILICLYATHEVLRFEVPFWATSFALFALIVIACDLTPKMIALAKPYLLSKIGVRFLQIVMPALDPACRVLQRASEKIADAITPARFKPNVFLSEEELETLIELSAEEGAIEETESELIQEIIKLGDKTVKDCMVPRIDMFGIPDDLSNEEVVAKIRAGGFRRIPVFAETPDEILGILDVKAFLFDPSPHYTEVMIPPSFVSETMKALDLLRSFLSHPQGMAVIVDEFGGTEGIITLADIIEDILGEAVPSGDEGLFIENLPDGRLIVNGRTRLDDLSERIGVELESEGVDTISGLIFNRLGYLPKPGLELSINGLQVTVRRTSRKRIEEVSIIPATPEAREDSPE